MRWAAAAAAWFAVSAWAATIHYGTVPQAIVEKHLRVVPSTNSEREQYLKEVFATSGCAGSVAEQAVKHSKTPNLICTLEGSDGAMIVVGAHFDFVNRGAGAIDNWSGASLLPSLYASVKTAPRRHTFVFIGFTDEEKGLVGSEYYVRHAGKEDLKKISAMINIDSIGVSTTRLDLQKGDKRLANALNNVAHTFNLPLSVVNVHDVGESDSDSFWKAHVPSITIHSITQESWPWLHTAKDQLAAIRMDDYYSSYRLLAAYLAYLDVTLDAAAASEAVTAGRR